MKGTARRGRWPAEDAAIAAELLASEKERAENLMIVDLIRNDLGKVARVGSVEVEELLALERYETVWQLTSQISAELRQDVGVGELFAALFPSGSVTGAPKRRSMEIITTLEERPRGVYCGAVGYLSPPSAPLPDVCFNVAIRTVLVDQGEGVAEYGVGGAITWGSSAGSEYEEAADKARVLVERRPGFDLIETMRWEPAHGWWWLDDHLDRLEASADYFGFSIDRPGVLAACRDAVAAKSGILRVRLALSRDGRIAVSVEAEHPASFQMGPDGHTDRIVLAIDDEPVDSGDPFLFHKTSLRDPYDERRARHPEADDVVLCNRRGEVTETSLGNLAVRVDGWWATPALDSGCLPGVLRGRLLDRGELIEDTITLDQFLAADAVAVLNSVRGWRPATILAAVPGT
jgi:para-aminobenzoate synthetase/4-amino-4-deoxychorismate lyase